MNHEAGQIVIVIEGDPSQPDYVENAGGLFGGIGSDGRKTAP
jgi:hypothetical protein